MSVACPHCGKLFGETSGGATPRHAYPETPVGGRLCPGSGQDARNPESDRRPLWKDLPGGRDPTAHERRGTADVTRPRAATPGDADPHPFDATQAARSILAAAGMPSVAGPDLDRAAEAVRREVEVYALLLVAAQVRLVKELRGGKG